MKIKLFFFSLLFISVYVCACFNRKGASSDRMYAGEQLIYSYTSEGIGYSDIQRLYTADSNTAKLPFFRRPSLQTTRVNIQCTLRKTILWQTDSITHTSFEIMQPIITIESGGLPVDVEVIKKEMGRPVFAGVTAAGNIRLVRTDTSISYLTVGIIKDILSNTQVVMPDKNVQQWLVTEENTSGSFAAKYQVVQTGPDSIEYLKTNIGYEKIKSAKKGQRFLPDNKTTIVADTSGVVKRINISESLITLFGNDTIIASANRVTYELLSKTKIAGEELLTLEKAERSGNYSVASALSAPISDEEINRLAYTNTLAGDNLETLTRKLGSVKAQDKQEESELVKKMRALAWLSPGDCSKLAALMKKASAESDTFRVISQALAAVETEFAINDIADVIAARSRDEKAMIELLPVLATTTFPTDKAVSVTKKLAFDKNSNPVISSTAQLTLGGLAKGYKKKDNPKADELTLFIIDKMKSEKDTLQQLLVYGNTGSARVLPVLITYINNPAVSPEFRKAAVFATRLIEHDDVGRLLQQIASGGKDTLLQKTARDVIGFRQEYSQK